MGGGVRRRDIDKSTLRRTMVKQKNVSDGRVYLRLTEKAYYFQRLELNARTCCAAHIGAMHSCKAHRGTPFAPIG
jgi:hypothetical protein